MDYTVEQVKDIVTAAKAAAHAAANAYFQVKLGGKDQFACGFAWVEIHGIKGNTKMGRVLKAAGIDQSYDRTFQIWNPSDLYVQNVDTLAAGAQAAAQVFRDHGFTAYARSRLD